MTDITSPDQYWLYHNPTAENNNHLQKISALLPQLPQYLPQLRENHYQANIKIAKDGQYYLNLTDALLKKHPRVVFRENDKIIATLEMEQGHCKFSSFIATPIDISCQFKKENILSLQIKSVDHICLSGIMEVKQAFTVISKSLTFRENTVRSARSSVVTDSYLHAVTVAFYQTETLEIFEKIKITATESYNALAKIILMKGNIKTKHLVSDAANFSNTGHYDCSGNFTVTAGVYHNEGIIQVQEQMNIYSDTYTDVGHTDAGQFTLRARESYIAGHFKTIKSSVILSEKKATVDKSAHITLGEEWLIDCQGLIEWFGNAVQSTVSQSVIHFNAGTNLEITGLISAHAVMTFTAKDHLHLVGVIEGKETTSTLQLSANDLIITGVMNNFASLKMKTASDLQLSETLKAEQTLEIEAPNIQLKSHLIAPIVILNANNDVICHEEAQIFPAKQFQVYGNRFINKGAIIGADCAMQSGCNVLTLNLGEINVANLQVDAGVFINSWMLTVKSTITINSLLALLGGVICSPTLQVNAVLQFNWGIYVPNFSDLTNFMQKNGIMSSLNQAVHYFFPNMMTAIQSGKLAFDYLSGAENIVEQLTELLVTLPKTIPFYKLIPIIVAIKNQAFLSVDLAKKLKGKLILCSDPAQNLEVEILNKMDAVKNQQYHFNKSLFNKVFSQALTQLEKIGFSHYSSDALYNINAGEIFALSIFERAYCMHNAALKAAMSTLSAEARYLNNEGHLLPFGNVSLSGSKLRNAGKIAAKTGTVQAYFDVIELTATSQSDYRHWIFKTQALMVEGTHNASATKIQTRILKLMPASEFSIADSELNVTQGTINGKLQLDNSKSQFDESLTVYRKGELQVQGGALQTHKLNMQGKMAVSQTFITGDRACFEENSNVSTSDVTFSFDHIDLNGQWQSNNYLYWQADEIQTGKNSELSGDILNVASKKMVHHGKMALSQACQITTDSLPNYGSLLAPHVDIKANHYFYNRGKVNADRMSITAGAFINACFGTVVASDSLSIHALINLNLLGIIRSHRVSNASLISFNAGLYLPATPTLNSFLNMDSLLNSTKVLLFSVSPMMGSVAGTLLSGYRTYKHIKQLYKVGKMQWNKGSAFAITDAISLAVGVKDLTSASLDCFSSAQTSWANCQSKDGFFNFKDFQFKTFTPELIWQQGKPTHSNATLIGSNFGAITSGDISEQSILSLNSAFLAGDNIRYQTLYGHHTYGSRSWANQFSFSGRQFRSAGILMSNKLEMDVNHFFVDAGNVTSHFAKVATQNTTVNAGASLTIKKGSLASKQLQTKGEFHFGSDAAQSELHVDQLTNAGEKLEIQQAQLKIDVLKSTPDSTTVISQSTAAVSDWQLEAKSNTTLRDSHIQGNTCDLLGKINAEGVNTIQSKGLDFHPEASIEGTGGIVLEGNGSRLGAVSCADFSTKQTTIDDSSAFLAASKQYNNIRPTRSLALEVDQNITLDQRMNRENVDVHLQAKAVQVDEEVTAQTLVMNTTEAGIQLNANLQAQKVLILKSAAEVINSRATHQAGEDFVVSAKGDVKNSGRMQAARRLEIEAEGDVYNNCNVQEKKGKYDTIKHFQPAELSGGTAGLHIKTSGKFKNDASIVASHGDNIIDASKGFENTDRSHQYVSMHKEEKRCWGFIKDKVTHETDTVQQSAIIFTDGGRNLINVEQGAIQARASGFISRDGTYLHARDDIEISGHKMHSSKTTDGRWCWNLLGSIKEEKHEHIVPSVFQGQGQTRLESDHNIYLSNTVLSNLTHLDLTSKNIFIRNEKEKHTISEKGRTLELHYFGESAFEAWKQGKSPAAALLSEDPLLHKTQQLFQSRSPLEMAANISNTAIEAFNTSAKLRQAYQQNDLTTAALSRYNLGGSEGFNPRVTLTVIDHHQSVSYETLGAGEIDVQSLRIYAAETCSIEGVAIKAEGNASISAQTLIQKGVALKSTQQSDSMSVGVSAPIFGGAIHLQSSYQQVEGQQTVYQQQTLSVGGHLQLAVGEALMDAAKIDAGSASGHIEKLALITRQDEIHARQVGFSACTSGQVGLSGAVRDAALSNQIASLVVHGKTEAEALTIGTVESQGGSIIADDSSQIEIEHFTGHEIKDNDQSRSLGISGNIAELLTPNDVTLSRMGVEMSQRDYQARLKPTLFGNKLTVHSTDGPVNRENEEGKVVTADNNFTLKIDVPVSFPAAKQAEFYFPIENESAEPIADEGFNSHLERENDVMSSPEAVSETLEIAFQDVEQAKAFEQFITEIKTEGSTVASKAKWSRLCAGAAIKGVKQSYEEIIDRVIALAREDRAVTCIFKSKVILLSFACNVALTEDPNRFKGAALETGAQLGIGIVMGKALGRIAGPLAWGLLAAEVVDDFAGSSLDQASGALNEIAIKAHEQKMAVLQDPSQGHIAKMIAADCYNDMAMDAMAANIAIKLFRGVAEISRCLGWEGLKTGCQYLFEKVKNGRSDAPPPVKQAPKLTKEQLEQISIFAPRYSVVTPPLQSFAHRLLLESDY